MDAAPTSFASLAGTGPERVVLTDVDATADGGAVVVGNFSGQATFGSVTLTADPSSTTSIPYADGVVFKVGPSGAVVWVEHLPAGHNSGFLPSTVAVTTTGDAMVAGSFTGRITLDGTTVDAQETGSDGFALLLSDSGTMQWARVTGSGPTNSTFVATGMAATPSGGAVIAARSVGTGVVLGEAGAVQFSQAFGITADGEILWATAIHDDLPNAGRVARTSGGDLVVAGTFPSTNGYSAVRAVKLNSDGVEQWKETVAADSARSISVIGLVATSDGGVAVGLADSRMTSCGLTGSTASLPTTVRVGADGSCVSYSRTNGVRNTGITRNLGGDTVAVGRQSGSGTNAYVAVGDSTTATSTPFSSGTAGQADPTAVTVLTDGSIFVVGTLTEQKSFGSTLLTSAGATTPPPTGRLHRQARTRREHRLTRPGLLHAALPETLGW